MYKHGKKIDITRKYTLSEAKALFVGELSKQYIFIADLFCHIAIMAFEDCKDKSTAEFVELLNKYVKDYGNGDFSKTDVRKYNTDAIKEFFRNGR